ncbi:MAG: alpha amylase C-terminal domain-containing protein, partial [Synechococcus sp.]
LNTDASRYGGSNMGNMGGKETEAWGIHGYDQSIGLCLPPLSLMVFRHDPKRTLLKDTNTSDDVAV